MKRQSPKQIQKMWAAGDKAESAARAKTARDYDRQQAPAIRERQQAGKAGKAAQRAEDVNFYKQQLSFLPRVEKPIAGEPSSEYENYMQKVRELKAGVKSGGDSGKAQDILKRQEDDKRLMEMYNKQKAQGLFTDKMMSFDAWKNAITQKIGVQNRALGITAMQRDLDEQNKAFRQRMNVARGGPAAGSLVNSPAGAVAQLRRGG